MKKKYKIFNAISNPFILAIILSIPLLLRPIISVDKFKAELLDISQNAPSKYYTYNDLDQDGNSECIQIDVNLGLNKTLVLVYSQQKIIDQWDFDGIIKGSDSNSIKIVNVDGDAFKEIFFITEFGNRLFLNLLNPFKPSSNLNNRFITDLKLINGYSDHSVFYAESYDYNNDKIRELYFSINAGYSTYPRQFYCYDIANDSLLISAPGCYHMTNIIKTDIDQDNIPEFVASISNAVGNCTKDTSFSDWYCWLLVFNPDLTFKFKPLKFGYHPSILGILPCSIGDSNYYYLIHVSRGHNSEIKDFIALFNPEGYIVKKKYIHFIDDLENISRILGFSHKLNENFVLFFPDVYSIDDQLNLIKEVSLPINPNHSMFTVDCNNDLKKEVIFHRKSFSQLVITTQEFDFPVTVDLYEKDFITHVDPVYRNGKVDFVFMEGDKYSYNVRYEKNKLYFLNYFYYPSIYIIVLIIIVFIRKTQQYQLKLKLQKEKHISELQIKSSLNQIEPHFTLNIVESLASLFEKSDRKNAIKVFGRFSKMLRDTLINSDKIQVTLAEELDYVDNYLTLMEFRYNKKFRHEISIPEDFKLDLQIPKTLIQTFVENAVKHGIGHLKGDEGMIRIDLSKNKRYYHIKISDNGVGRIQANEYAMKSTGKGLLILDEILVYYNKEYQRNIRYHILDLKSDNVFKGTRVTISIAKS